MSVNFLLIGRPGNTGWPEVLRLALAPLGVVETVSEADAAERIAQYQCNVIVIIDAAVVEDVPVLISHLLHQCPKCRIVVATTTFNLQLFREACRAGAADCILKSWDTKELLNTIRSLVMSLPREEETL